MLAQASGCAIGRCCRESVTQPHAAPGRWRAAAAAPRYPSVVAPHTRRQRFAADSPGPPRQRPPEVAARRPVPDLRFAGATGALVPASSIRLLSARPQPTVRYRRQATSGDAAPPPIPRTHVSHLVAWIARALGRAR